MSTPRRSLGRALAEFDVRERTPVIVVVILVWLAVNLAFAFLVNLPRARQAEEIQRALDRAAELLASRDDDVTRLREQHQRVMSGRSTLDNFYDDVLSTKQERFISFQSEIREIARRFNVNMESVSYPRESFPRDKVIRFGASMPLTGSYENLRQFVDTIERSSNFIVIDSIQLTSAKEGGVILSLLIKLSTYFIDPDLTETTQAGERS